MSAPSTSAVFSDRLEGYYKSLERLFLQTRRFEQSSDVLGFFAVASILGLVFSILPVIPLVLVKSIPWVAGKTSFSVFRQQLPLTSFRVWWAVAVVGCAVVTYLVFKLTGWRDKKRRHISLSEPQMRFCRCYGVVVEIRNYLTNRLPNHIDAAVELYSAFDRNMTLFAAGDHQLIVMAQEGATELLHDGSVYPTFRGPFGIVRSLAKTFPWFRLAPQTDAIVQAFSIMRAVIPARLSDRKDLAAIADCLTNLSAYLYGSIPDLAPDGEVTGGAFLAGFGERGLTAFAEGVNALGPYTPQQEPESSYEPVLRKLGAKAGFIFRLFSHENIIVCLLAWYVFFQGLFVVALKVALFLLPNQRIEPQVLAVLIGGPPAAAAAVAVARSARRINP